MTRTLTALMLAPLLTLAGCNTMTPNYDQHFGEAVRNARQQMTINPNAAIDKPGPAPGIDGVAAHETMLRYQQSFQNPPPVVNVINIGGAIGSGNGSDNGSGR
ncbi:MAG: hypothetical protein JSS56_29850 [Proteobacteria bacterium]|nr:hypothetical protein [Pseudomonadota bacterium]